jgi:hypothetical protein
MQIAPIMLKSPPIVVDEPTLPSDPLLRTVVIDVVSKLCYSFAAAASSAPTERGACRLPDLTVKNH